MHFENEPQKHIGRNCSVRSLSDPEFVRWRIHLVHREHSVCAACDHLHRCNPLVCAVDGHVLRESKTEQVAKPREPTQQELVLSAFLVQWMLVNSSAQERLVMLVAEALRRIAHLFANVDVLKGPGS